MTSSMQWRNDVVSLNRRDVYGHGTYGRNAIAIPLNYINAYILKYYSKMEVKIDLATDICNYTRSGRYDGNGGSAYDQQQQTISINMEDLKNGYVQVSNFTLQHE